MQVKDIMSTKVRCVAPDALVAEAARTMRDQDVGSLPVRLGKGDGELLGIITDRDITCRTVAVGLDPIKTKVSDVMTKGVACCFADQDVKEAARLMEQKQLHRLPVTDHNNHLVGILALADVATHTSRELSGEVIEAISKRAH
jgi:CBS domain-containing protein